MKYLLDTNIISEFISKKPNQKVLEFITSLDESHVFLSVITIGEIKFGIEKVKSEKKKETLLHWLYNDLLERFDGRIVDIDTDMMLKRGEVNQHLQSIGKPMPIMDSLIASSCLAKDFVLITRNEKDFYSFDIEMINPF
ncbi:MAG: Unknown protein [uncultured Sulfurovum sp.]|uniref:PIN domain-containing protein n=1 Tax=uncultured Sulfurovum sp. TaxID=269237 RepID=A0A6S6SCV9_9BACT|nr:MAG: Unknown protein [uncultured Sulfurovum sp.]